MFFHIIHLIYNQLYVYEYNLEHHNIIPNVLLYLCTLLVYLIGGSYVNWGKKIRIYE